MQSKAPKRVFKGGKSSLYLPEGFRPTEIGIKNLHRKYYAGSEVSKFDTTKSVKRPKVRQSGFVQKVENQSEINSCTAKSYVLASQGKEKPKNINLSIEKLHKLYNVTAENPMTLAQFRTKSKRRSFQKTLRQLATHQY